MTKLGTLRQDASVSSCPSLSNLSIQTTKAVPDSHRARTAPQRWQTVVRRHLTLRLRFDRDSATVAARQSNGEKGTRRPENWERRRNYR